MATKVQKFYAGVAAIAMIGVSNVAVANNTENADLAISAKSSGAVPSAGIGFARFIPTSDPVATRIDYSIWDEALDFFVLQMGQSLREGAPTVQAGTGTRRIYGHDSRYRLEGNRIVFSFLSDEVITSLTEYRKDLEQTANIVEISSLRRNEQLAYWINLHNVAIIEQIALAYPVSQPSKLKLGEAKIPLDDAPFINVAGVAMSPKDIRTKIVYPNWKNPKVLYGFFRGDIGGPSIQKEAFTAGNVDELLDISAREFVNSLRGTQKNGARLEVSKIYDEARPFYFTDWPTDIRTHLNKYGQPEVQELIDKTQSVEAKIYEADISDLANGEKDPNYLNINSSTGEDGFRPRSSRIPQNIARLLSERQQKRNKMVKRGILQGRVYFIELDGQEVVETEVD